ncbi:hypothetical protein EG327_003255, partial [Venturia inaequalis]
MQFSLSIIFATLLAAGVNAQVAEVRLLQSDSSNITCAKANHIPLSRAAETASTLATALAPATAVALIAVVTLVVAPMLTAATNKALVSSARQDKTRQELRGMGRR